MCDISLLIFHDLVSTILSSSFSLTCKDQMTSGRRVLIIVYFDPKMKETEHIHWPYILQAFLIYTENESMIEYTINYITNDL